VDWYLELRSDCCHLLFPKAELEEALLCSPREDPLLLLRE
jgi:hypothetical protein